MSAAGFSLVADGARRHRAAGSLSFETAAAALPVGLALLPAGGELVFDLAGIVAADSAGLAVLIEWMAQARARGVRLRFEAVPASLASIAGLSGIDFLLEPESRSGPPGR